jgi:hypothetical protein
MCSHIGARGGNTTYHHICVAAFDSGLLLAFALLLGRHAPTALRLLLISIRLRAPSSGHARLYQWTDCACAVRLEAFSTPVVRSVLASQLHRRHAQLLLRLGDCFPAPF